MENNQQLTTKPKYLVALENEMPQIKSLIALNAQPNSDVAAIALQELDYLRLQAMTKTDIAECVPSSVVLAVKSVMKNNLTLDPSAGLVYIKTRNIKVGNETVKTLEITPSCNGLISIARQCGRIIDIKRPTIDKDVHGKVIGVSVEFQLPNGRWEKCDFDESDFERWQRASDKEMGRFKPDHGAPAYKYANANYTNWKGGLDPEFARAKAIRHGLKKLGANPNEKYAKQITIEDKKEILIDPSADIAATADEMPSDAAPNENVQQFEDAQVISETMNENKINNEIPNL